MFGGDYDTNDSSGDESFPPQPPSYPDPDQLDQSLTQMYYASSPESSSSSIIMYDAIDSDTAKMLPEGDLHDCDMMQDSNASIVYVPRLGPDPQSVCKLPGCNRPRFMDPGGKVHACCGKYHALQYEQQNDQESKMATNVDGQGKQRGRCSSCACDGYDGGLEKKRCVACGHPPGKHQNLSTSSSVSGSSSGVSSISVLSPPSTSTGFCDGRMTFYSNSSNSAVFMPSPVYQCRYPGCQKESDFEPNTGIQSDYCHQHIQMISQQQYAFTTPRTPQWSIGGNTDSNDNDHDLRSQAQSDTHGGSLRSMPAAAPSSSSISSSSSSSWGWANAFSSLLTLRTSTKRTKSQQPVCKLCSKQRHPNGEGGYFDYCSKHCQDHGLQPSNPSIIRQANQQEFSQVSRQFTRDWDRRKGTCPKVDYVYVVSNSVLETKWSAYKQTLKDQSVEEHYHGTKLICNLSSMPCTSADCGICGISSMGLDRRCIRKNITFQRFGHGFYLAPNSSKCHDYTQGANGYRAMLLLAVCPGRKYYLKRDNVNLKGPPPGYNCVYAQAGFYLNYPEIAVYNPDAVVPRYIIVYQKDGVHKIAK